MFVLFGSLSFIFCIFTRGWVRFFSNNRTVLAPFGSPPYPVQLSDFSVTDDLSGVAYVKAFVDGVELKKGRLKLDTGGHILEVEAMDRAGNVAVEERILNLVNGVISFISESIPTSTPTVVPVLY